MNLTKIITAAFVRPIDLQEKDLSQADTEKNLFLKNISQSDALVIMRKSNVTHSPNKLWIDRYPVNTNHSFLFKRSQNLSRHASIQNEMTPLQMSSILLQGGDNPIFDQGTSNPSKKRRSFKGLTKEQAIAIINKANKEANGEHLGVRKYEEIRATHTDWPCWATLARVITGTEKWILALDATGISQFNRRRRANSKEHCLKILKMAIKESGGIANFSGPVYESLRAKHSDWPCLVTLCRTISNSRKLSKTLHEAGYRYEKRDRQILLPTRKYLVILKLLAIKVGGADRLTQATYKKLRKNFPDLPKPRTFQKLIAGKNGSWKTVIKMARYLVEN